MERLDTLGEEIFRKFIAERGATLVLNKIPRNIEKETPDFFVKESGSLIAVCEVKDLEEPDHHFMNLSTELLTKWSERQEKLKEFSIKTQSELTEEEKIELKILQKEEQEDQKIEDEFSGRLGKKYQGQFDRHFRKAIRQLGGYEHPKILVFIIFCMADYIDLKKYLEESEQKENRQFLDMCILLNVHEKLKGSGCVDITNATAIIFSKIGKVLLNNNFCFFSKLQLPLKLKL